MSSLTKCIGCEEPIQEDALSCLECGTRQVRPRSGRLWIYLCLALFGVLETYYIWQARKPLCLALAVGAVLSMSRLKPKSETKRKREMTNELLGCRNFESASLFVGCDGRSGFAVDRRRHRICLLTHDGKKSRHLIVSHRDILAVELMENDRPVVTASRVSQRNGSNGNAANAPTPGVVVALTGKTVASPAIWQISLRITVRNCTTAPHEVAFLAVEVAKGGVAYGKVKHSALCWFRIVDAFIQRAGLEEIRARDGFRESNRIVRRQGVYR